MLAAISADGELFALGTTNGIIQVWQEGADEPLYSLRSDFEWTALSFSPDGKSLVTSADAVKVWNAGDGSLRFNPGGELTSYMSALFSPDGAQLVTQEPGLLHLWNMSDGALLRSLGSLGSQEALPPAAFSPDGTLLVSSGADGMGFWQVSDGTMLHSLETSTSPAAFSADGSMVIGMGDGIVETWGMPAP